MPGRSSSQIESDEATRLRFELREPRPLERHVVVIVEVVEPDDFIAARAGAASDGSR